MKSTHCRFIIFEDRIGIVGFGLDEKHMTTDIGEEKVLTWTVWDGHTAMCGLDGNFYARYPLFACRKCVENVS